MNSHVLQEISIRYFLEVVRTGSVSEAASRLDVAPSAVSRHIARLERELDTLLFERRARGMVPNAAGELLAAHAQRAQQDIDRITEDIMALKGLRQGHVRVVCTEGYATDFVPTLVADFRKRHAGIRFTLDICSQQDIPQRIRDGQADVGVTLSLTSQPGIQVELRTPAPIMAILSPDHPLAGKRQLSLAQLAAYPLALPGPDSTLRQLFDISCSRQRLQYQPVITSRSIAALVGFACAGGGIALSGELAVRRWLQWGWLTALPIRDREMNERHFEVQTLAGRLLPAACKAFITDIARTVKAG